MRDLILMEDWAFHIKAFALPQVSHDARAVAPVRVAEAAGGDAVRPGGRGDRPRASISDPPPRRRLTAICKLERRGRHGATHDAPRMSPSCQRGEVWRTGLLLTLRLEDGLQDMRVSYFVKIGLKQLLSMCVYRAAGFINWKSVTQCQAAEQWLLED